MKQRLTFEEYERLAKEKEETYNKESDGGFKCKICESQIMGSPVIFPIHDGPFDGAGSGKVERQYFPYCPKCDQNDIPDIQGIPIRIKN